MKSRNQCQKTPMFSFRTGVLNLSLNLWFSLCLQNQLSRVWLLRFQEALRSDRSSTGILVSGNRVSKHFCPVNVPKIFVQVQTVPGIFVLFDDIWQLQAYDLLRQASQRNFPGFRNFSGKMVNWWKALQNKLTIFFRKNAQKVTYCVEMTPITLLTQFWLTFDSVLTQFCVVKSDKNADLTYPVVWWIFQPSNSSFAKLPSGLAQRFGRGSTPS